MIDHPHFLNSLATELECHLASFRAVTPAIIPQISGWLASAVLQKSIRRGRSDFALAAASVLQARSEARLWRRLVVIAVEDVGLGDLEAVYMTVAAAACRRRLRQTYDATRLLSFIVGRLATATKCRATDDLYVATEDCAAWQQDRLDLVEKPLDELLEIILGDDTIERRAVAVRYAIGTDRSASSSLARRPGHPDTVSDFMSDALPHTLVAVAGEAYRQTGEVIAAFLPLLHQDFDGCHSEVRPDDLPPEVLVRGLPGWALDKFSREGQAALGRFLGTDCATTRWLRGHLPPSDRLGTLGRALFQVESGLVKDRLIWPTAKSLRRQADLESWPFSTTDAAELLAALRADIPLLNRSRESSYGR